MQVILLLALTGTIAVLFVWSSLVPPDKYIIISGLKEGYVLYGAILLSVQCIVLISAFRYHDELSKISLYLSEGLLIAQGITFVIMTYDYVNNAFLVALTK